MQKYQIALHWQLPGRLGRCLPSAFVPFVEHRAIILLGVGVVLAVAWAVLLLRSSLCPRRRRTGVILALVCTAFFAAAVTAPLWERDAMRAMWAYWTDRP